MQRQETNSGPTIPPWTPANPGHRHTATQQARLLSTPRSRTSTPPSPTSRTLLPRPHCTSTTISTTLASTRSHHQAIHRRSLFTSRRTASPRSSPSRSTLRSNRASPTSLHSTWVLLTSCTYAPVVITLIGATLKPHSLIQCRMCEPTPSAYALSYLPLYLLMNLRALRSISTLTTHLLQCPWRLRFHSPVLRWFPLFPHGDALTRPALTPHRLAHVHPSHLTRFRPRCLTERFCFELRLPRSPQHPHSPQTRYLTPLSRHRQVSGEDLDLVAPEL